MIRPGLACGIALTSLLSLSWSLAVAQPSPSASLAQASTDAEALPTSRAMIAALSLLSKAGFEEQALKASTPQASRANFAVAGQPFALHSGPGAGVSRLASSTSAPGVAMLVPLPEVSAGMSSGDPARDARYALVTVNDTRVRLWAFYSQTPSDGALSRRMVAALALLGPPLAMIDPAFSPPVNAVGLDRYMLK